MFKQIPDQNGQTCQNRPANHININQPSVVKLEIIFKSQYSLMAKKYKISEVCTLGLSFSMHAVLVILSKYTINSCKVRLDLYFSA